jgi:putative OPT family oligopeptide transporter
MTTQSEHNHDALPENAYKELGKGETYTPVMQPNQSYPEVTRWSVAWGLFMAILFSAAAAYAGLKIGQVMETGIPIAVLAVGISTILRKHDKLGQNVIVQSIGATSGGIVAGAIFTIPALFILNLTPKFYQMFIASLLGGVLGILFIIPFRKYFVKEMHGKFPFPEATAATEILITTKKSGSQALVLIVSGLIGGLNDFLVSSVGAWSDVISSRVFSFGATVADKTKIVGKMSTLSMILGMGYIIGLKYSAIICAGSFLSWFVLTPLFNEVGQNLLVPLGSTTTKLISAMSAEQIFSIYVKHIGIGAIAMAGLIGIIRSYKIIFGACKLTICEIFKKKIDREVESRWQTDIKIPYVVLFILLTALLIFVFLIGGVSLSLSHALIGLLLVIIIAFLFTTVAANAIAIVGSSPVSGMTLMTLILSSFVLGKVGLSGNAGILSALIIGGIVCTALAIAGSFITDLKIGYWLGSTPKKQESWKFLGTLISSATVVGVIFLLNKTYGFTGPNALVAPQANAMAAVIQPLMSNISAPWMLYFLGAVLVLILTILKVPALPFALGMYLPQELNTPLLVGGLIAWLVATRSKNAHKNNARASRGTLIASGFIAGGSLFGVIGALLKFSGIDLLQTAWQQTNGAEILGFGMFTLLVIYLFIDAMRAKPR